MQSLQKLKKELKFNFELAELLDILKGIAASEFRSLEKRKERFSKFIEAFSGFFGVIDFSSVEHPFSKGGENLGIIMITSDEGFMGGLNNRVINAALGYPGSDDAVLIVVGNWGAGYLRSLGRHFKAFSGISSEKQYKAVIELKDFVITEGMAGTFNRLILAYPKPLSFTVQKVEILTILPCSELFGGPGHSRGSGNPDRRFPIEDFGNDPAGVYPRANGGGGRQGKRGNDTQHIPQAQRYIMESPFVSIIEYLLSEWVTHKLLEVFEDSKLSEFSARTVHLEESHQILLRRGKSLKQQYFRSYHEFVDRNMREIFSAQVIRKKRQGEKKYHVSGIRCQVE